MDHVQLIESMILTESRASQTHRDAIHPHASGALMCPRRNILQWIELTRTSMPQLLSDYLSEPIKTVTALSDKVPGVFTVGHIYDKWMKRMYERIAAADSSITAVVGTPRIFNLPMTEEDIGVTGAIPIAGEFDMLVKWGGDAQTTDLIDFKTCKSLYMYKKKGPSMHHIAQLSVYAYGLMVNRFDSMLIKPEHLEQFRHDTRLILIYIEKNNAELLVFHIQLFPLRSLRMYYNQLRETMRSIRGQTRRQEQITRELLPPACPSFDWECKWKTGSCKYYETFCKEEQDALKGTVERAKAGVRDDKESSSDS